MQRFEYKVIPAPRRGEKGKGVKSVEDRFAYAMAHVMNDLGREGWEYLRADTLPCDERVGLTGTKTTYQSVLVFRRAGMAAEAEDGAGAIGQDRLTLVATPAVGVTPRLGAADAPAGSAPTLGPAPRGGVVNG